ncbi:MAG: peptidoglycan editing factor PgeF [Gammaproteobacteria bacterium]|nr:peptidoglycan editing factor PgeF [Gammaproteobacteria bacterium]
MRKLSNYIYPDWPAPANIRAVTTTRQGGVSERMYQGFNLALHVEDDPQHVMQNRQILVQQLDLPSEPVWLNQVHSNRVIDAANTSPLPSADAAYALDSHIVCCVMTADCLPVLICNKQGTKVAAAHAGWRGLLDGVIEASITCLEEPAENILVWLGPAIGPGAFEVGDEVRAGFEARQAEASVAFTPARPGHWLADIYQLARIRLKSIGVTAVYGGEFCSVTDAKRFYSYRRDGQTGRMASLIWSET